MIELEDVSVRVGGTTILSHCTVALGGSSLIYLVGSSSSSTTTLLRAIAELQRYSGSIRFDGRDACQARGELYICFDDAPVFPYLSGYDNVRMLANRPLSRAAIEAVSPAIAGRALLHRRARKLTLGQRKAIHLVAALASGARFIVFDEALHDVEGRAIPGFAGALQQASIAATVVVTGQPGELFAELGARRLELAYGQLTFADQPALSSC